MDQKEGFCSVVKYENHEIQNIEEEAETENKETIA